MVKIKYGELTFEGNKAIKGSNYIRVLDSNNCIVASIDGITDFTGIALVEGSWTDAAAISNCKVAVMREDGTVAEGDKACCDLLTNKQAMVLKENLHYGTSLPSSGTEGQVFFKLAD